MTTISGTTSGDEIQVRKAFEDSLRGIGYPSEQIHPEYGYSDFLGNGQRLTIDLAAFGGSVPSLRTCNIGVLIESHIAEQELVRVRALGAPLLFTYDLSQGKLGRWKIPEEGPPSLLESPANLTLDGLPGYFAEHRYEWQPEAFRQARTATFQAEAPQLDFFDLGLLPALEGQLQIKLSAHFQAIASRSRQILNDRNDNDTFESQFSAYARLLFRLLAAKLLSDRGDLSTLAQTTDVSVVLQAVERKYHAGETIEPGLNDPTVQKQVWDTLRTGLDLRNLSPESLAFVYENTLVDRDLRRRNGIHATPPHVADFLLRQLPIHRLPEAERVVFEPFCGNAPFLLAAMRQLRELLPPEPARTPDEVHEYLKARLLGIELLPIAREIARYSLILGDYPNDNSWQITEANAFTDPIFDTYLQKAQIVLSNPPHEDFSAGERPDGAHHNRAAEALRRVLLHPPKLLGFVMPLSFVDGNDYKALRQQLVEKYPDISVTSMPDNVFGKASQQTALIAAHRLDLNTNKRYIFAFVSADDYRSTFRTTGRATITEDRETLPQSADGSPVIWQKPSGELKALWNFLASYSTLNDFAELHRGLEWRTKDGETSSTSSAVSFVEREGFAPGLHKADNSIEDYVTTQVSYLDVRPESILHKPRQWKWYQHKALVNDAGISIDVWRLLAVADTEGLYASQRFNGVWPKTELLVSLSAEVISALLNGPVANASVHQNSNQRDNHPKILKRIPVPSFTQDQINEITALVDAYKDLRWEQLETPKPWTGNLAERGRRALLKIDAAILEAYVLPPNWKPPYCDSSMAWSGGICRFPSLATT
jgi:type I restriction-modification system DNA methylase subunit